MIPYDQCFMEVIGLNDHAIRPHVDVSIIDKSPEYFILQSPYGPFGWCKVLVNNPKISNESLKDAIREKVLVLALLNATYGGKEN